MSKDIYEELNLAFEEIGYPNGMGYYMGTGEEPVFIVYLVYDDEVTGRSDDSISVVTHRLKVDIIARKGLSFTDAEKTVRKVLKQKGYIYKNGEVDVDTKEPYNYHRVLYYDIIYHFDDLDKEII